MTMREALRRITPSLKRESTWRGLVAVLMSFGLAVDVTQTTAIITIGIAIGGAIDLFTDNK